MTFRLALAAPLVSLVGLAGQAVAEIPQINGGSVELRYSEFREELDDDETISRSSLGGSIEVGLTRSFALQGDLHFHEYGFSDLDGRSAAIHGIYHASDVASLGAFYGKESVDGEDADFYGVEAGVEFRRADAEIYFTRIEDEFDVEADLYGVSGRFEIRPWISVTAAADRGDFDGGVEIDRTVIGLEADVGSVVLSADYGHFGGEIDDFGSDSEPFVALGARYDFGAERGATFGARGLNQLIPGL